MGSGLGYEKLMSIQLDDPEAKLISMQHFHGLIEMKKETAVFGAATTVNDVIAILASHHRMLPCSPGVIGIQTLAGAIATGTHGQEQILCKGIPIPQINCEIAIPFEHTREATLAIKSWADVHKKYLHYPFIYRATGQSKAWLNPAYKGPVCYIGFLVYVAEDGSVRDDGMATMHELQMILAPFGGIPHWGKHFQPDIYDFERLIPKWKDFLDLRAQLDPNRKILSAFLESVFKLNDAHYDD
ncbi:unnamed protein product [Rotaria sp. Silwood1]|nr:unnamed protein product [Rotaria sp. Silwood1]